MQIQPRWVLLAALFPCSFASACVSEVASGADEPGKLGEVEQAFISPDATEVRAGTDHTCVRRFDGRVTCWGRADRGQMGDGVTPPPSSHLVVSSDALVLTQTLATGTWLAAGSDRACILLASKSAKCWGTSTGGWAGGASGPTPGLLPLSNIDEIALPKRSYTWGHTDTACARSGGAVQCWGSNAFGLLGTGSKDALDHPTPATVPGLGSGVAQIALGETHACARFTNGTVSCWGDNSVGQLGDGTTTSTTAVGAPIVGLTGVVQLAVGIAHTCALKSDGTIRCWGNGGTIGDGTTLMRKTPTMPVQFVYAAELVAGADFTCARTVDNSVQCWGQNSWGQLGTGNNTAATLPTAIGLGNVVQLTAGEFHACARTNTHAVLCWGRNAWGQIGDGTTTMRQSPTPVFALSGT